MRQRIENLTRSESGFTLVELLVVISILALALGGLAATFDTSNKVTVKSEAESAASSIARREIEAAANLPFTATRPTATTGSAGWSSTATTVGVTTANEPTAGTPGIDRDGGTWTSRSGVTGSIYRYVTGVSSANDPLRKITIAVTAGQLGAPVVMSVFRRNPDAGPGGTTGSGGPCATVGVVCNP